MRFPTYEIPALLVALKYPNHIALPRGCFEEVSPLLSDLNIKITLKEEHCIGQPLNGNFQGQLRSEQQATVNALLAHDIGVLSATTPLGKLLLQLICVPKYARKP
ncbi:MAG: hypothetical protein H0V82_00940 [Candidatus Protochlamydia sp.]|nr:hypothetical protein [Candidatus Protochlamydia sp.]